MGGPTSTWIGGWEGSRGGELNAIQPDPKKFTDIKGMVDEIHKMGLKVGLYSSPWVTTYGGQIGGTSNDPKGAWDHATMTKGPKNKKVFPFAIGEHHFFTNDAKQWADWGIDYVKWDWGPLRGAGDEGNGRCSSCLRTRHCL